MGAFMLRTAHHAPAVLPYLTYLLEYATKRGFEVDVSRRIVRLEDVEYYIGRRLRGRHPRLEAIRRDRPGEVVAELNLARLNAALAERRMHHAADYEERIQKPLRIFVKKIEKDARGES
jgi:hypothetical protein